MRFSFTYSHYMVLFPFCFSVLYISLYSVCLFMCLYMDQSGGIQKINKINFLNIYSPRELSTLGLKKKNK